MLSAYRQTRETTSTVMLATGAAETGPWTWGEGDRHDGLDGVLHRPAADGLPHQSGRPGPVVPQRAEAHELVDRPLPEIAQCAGESRAVQDLGKGVDGPLGQRAPAGGVSHREVDAGTEHEVIGGGLAHDPGHGPRPSPPARPGRRPPPKFQVPHRAELVVGAVVAVLAAITDVRGAIGFSSFGVLAYYAIANASAWTLAPDEGRPARITPVVGLAGCLVLAFALPATSVMSGAAVLAAGAAAYAVRRAVTARRP